MFQSINADDPSHSPEESSSLVEYVLAMVETNDDVGLMDFFQQQQVGCPWITLPYYTEIS